MTLTRRCHRVPACFWCALLMVVTLWPVVADAQPWVATDILAPSGVTNQSRVRRERYRPGGRELHHRRWTDPRLFLDAAPAGSSILEHSAERPPRRWA